MKWTRENLAVPGLFLQFLSFWARKMALQGAFISVFISYVLRKEGGALVESDLCANVGWRKGHVMMGHFELQLEEFYLV